VAWLGVRPENMSLCDPEQAAITGTLVVCEYLGAEQFAYVDCGLDDVMTVRVDPEMQLGTGGKVGIDLQADRLHLFDQDGNRT